MSDNIFFLDQLAGSREINPREVTQADLVVGILTYNEAANIGRTTRKISEGLALYFSDLTSVIIDCDNSSMDGTGDLFLAEAAAVPKIYLSTPPGFIGKGANFINLLRRARQLRAKAVIILNGNLLTIKRTWIHSLASPILKPEGSARPADFVAPLYVRNKYESPVTRMMVYGLFRSMFGYRVRQPISVDAAVSGRLAEMYLNYPGWPREDCGYILDMTRLIQAVRHEGLICQSYTAHPRLKTAPGLDGDLSMAFHQITDSLFSLILENDQLWVNVKRSRPTLVSGLGREAEGLAGQVSHEVEAIYSQLQEAGAASRGLWRDIFGTELAGSLKGLLEARPEQVNLEIETWVALVYRGLLAYRAEPAGRRDIIQALWPLFCAKLLTYYKKTSDLNDVAALGLIEAEAQIFEDRKKAFTESWLK